MELEQIKDRFLKEPPTMRLGHLASDLLRIAGFLESGMISEAGPVIRESKFFAEWAAPEAGVELQSLLAEVQSFLALKELRFNACEDSSGEFEETIAHTRKWSQELLKEVKI